MKLNIGVGNKPLPGHVNCDIRKLDGVDKVFDLEKPPYPFKPDSVEFIVTEETLEHISHVRIDAVFKEFYRILKKGGKVSIQVPNIGRMCENYINKEICDCVPQKSETLEGFKAKSDCSKCNGKGKVHPLRWILALGGAQKHPWDFHKMFFTKEIMEAKLNTFGFKNIIFEDNPYKIKVKAEKW